MSPRRGADQRRALVCLAVIGLASGCVSDRPSSTGPVDTTGEPVEIRNFAFQPPDLTVPAGSPIVWTNADAAPHTVTADDGSFDSSVLSQGNAFRLVPDQRGDFPYFCTIHPFMRAVLHVTE